MTTATSGPPGWAGPVTPPPTSSSAPIPTAARAMTSIRPPKPIPTPM